MGTNNLREEGGVVGCSNEDTESVKEVDLEEVDKNLER